ncbi:MAG: ROK family transcriptional regulator [Anaerolineae bacterium]|nr:ROK family transcriptional regulator [Anaerolineae bacterium]
MPLSHTPELMRQQNRAMLLQAIQEQGPISRIDLASLLNLNPATITRIVRMLIDDGLVIEEGEGENKGAGRKPVLLRFNHRARLIIGINISHHQMTGMVADLGGNPLSRRTLLLSKKLSAEALLDLTEELFSENPGFRQRLVTLCIGSEKHSMDFLYTLRTELEHQLGLPVSCYDPAALAAVGEAEAGSMKEQPVFALFYLGHQSLSCLSIYGQLHTGWLGLAADGRSLAEVVCENGLMNAYQVANGSSPQPPLIFEAARNADPAAVQAVEKMAAALAQAAAWVRHLAGIQHVVIAGPWIRSADPLIPAIRRQLAALTEEAPEIVPAALKTDASLMGAVYMAVRVADTTV